VTCCGAEVPGIAVGVHPTVDAVSVGALGRAAREGNRCGPCS
jgi:hypothetical protein